MAELPTPDPVAPGMVPPSAVVWINGRRAIVATVSSDGRISTCEIDRGLGSELSYVGRVVHAIGDRERLVILGPSSVRLDLEHEYVANSQRPDRLVDVEPAGAMDTASVVERLRALTA